MISIIDCCPHLVPPHDITKMLISLVVLAAEISVKKSVQVKCEPIFSLYMSKLVKKKPKVDEVAEVEMENA